MANGDVVRFSAQGAVWFLRVRWSNEGGPDESLSLTLTNGKSAWLANCRPKDLQRSNYDESNGSFADVVLRPALARSRPDEARFRFEVKETALGDRLELMIVLILEAGREARWEVFSQPLAMTREQVPGAGVQELLEHLLSSRDSAQERYSLAVDARKQMEDRYESTARELQKANERVKEVEAKGVGRFAALLNHKREKIRDLIDEEEDLKRQLEETKRRAAGGAGASPGGSARGGTPKRRGRGGVRGGRRPAPAREEDGGEEEEEEEDGDGGEETDRESGGEEEPEEDGAEDGGGTQTQRTEAPTQPTQPTAQAAAMAADGSDDEGKPVVKRRRLPMG